MRTVFKLLAGAMILASVPTSAAQKDQTAAAKRDRASIALSALSDVDPERLLREKPYAEHILRQISTVRESKLYTGDRRMGVDRLAMLALIGAEKYKEAHAQAADLLKREPRAPDLHYFAFLLALDLDPDLALAQLEQAAKSLRSPEARADFAQGIELETVHQFRRPFHLSRDKGKLARSAKALLDLGIPGPNHLELAEGYRLDIADDLLSRGDVSGARKVVRSLSTLEPVLTVLISNRWAPVREAADPSELLARAIAASDQATARAAADNPGDSKLLLRRAQFLRSIGKEEEALALLRPKAENFDWVKEEGEYGYWIVNEAAYALLALKRQEEAVALMDKLMTIGLDKNPVLISMAINKAEIMIDTEDFGAAAEHAEMLARDHLGIASPYGHMWMWASAVCGHYFAGEAAAAQPWLTKLKAGEADNPAALTRALLCADELDLAAAAIIRRLDGKEVDDALRALQDYTIKFERPARDRLLEDRLRQVIARADVQAAIARHGRILKVPLSRHYWGMF